MAMEMLLMIIDVESLRWMMVVVREMKDGRK